MLELLVAIGPVAVFLGLDLVLKAQFYRTRLGRFKCVSVGDDGSRMITTDYGQFKIDTAQRLLRIRSGAGRETSVPFSDIQGLGYKYDTRFALLPEFLFGGWPVLKRYEDSYEWYHIYLVLKNVPSIPVYSIGTYEQRGFMIGWLVRLEKWLFMKIGVYQDIERRSQEVLSEVKQVFGGAQLPATLGNVST